MGFIVWVLFRKRAGVGWVFVPLAGVIGLYSLVASAQLAIGEPTTDVRAAAEALAILLSPIGLCLGLATCIDAVSPRALVSSAVVSASIGMLQMFAAGFLKSSGVSQVLALAIPRLAVAQPGGGRGVSMLAPEPAYAAPTIMLTLVAAIWLRRRGRMSKPVFVSCLAIIALMVALNASVTLVTAVALFVALLALVEVGRHPRLLPVAIAIPILGLLLLSAFQQSPFRPIRVSGEISASLIRHGPTAETLVAVSQLNGSTRFGSVLDGYAGSLNNWGFGLGLASWGNWIRLPADMPNPGGRLKPYAYGAFVAMTLGFPGLAALGLCLVLLIRKCLGARPLGYLVATITTSLVLLLANSPTSLLAPWAMLLFVIPSGVPKSSDPGSSRTEAAVST